MKINLQIFGGGSSSSTTSSYTPSEYELQLQRAQANYADAISPNSLYLNDTARNVLQNSLGTVQVDFNNLNNNAQNQIASANTGQAGIVPYLQSGIETINNRRTDLANGELPTNYTNNMADAVRSGVTNTVGTAINSLGNRGVLNSSVTNKAMNDIENNVADTMAQSYTNNINTLSGIYNNASNDLINGSNVANNTYNNQISNATSGITTAAAAQEAAQQPALNLWNASLGLNGSTTSALAAAAGKGTTNSTQTTSGGGLLSGLLGGL